MPPLASSDAFLFYALTALCVLLALGLTGQAWRRTAGSRAVLRMLAGWLAAAALWLTAYPPQRHVTGTATDAAILLTEGYSADSLAAVHRRLGPVPVLYYRPLRALRGDTVPLTALSTLATQFPAVRQVHVLGRGIPVADLAAVPTYLKLSAHPAANSPAFVAAAWPRQLALGQSLQLTGTFAGAGDKPVWVRLVAEGAARDSVRVKHSTGTFVLRYAPRRVGELVARVEARQAGVTLTAEPVPTRVLPARRLRVLLLAGSPSFELNLLKNRLAERGHQVALRLRVSRGLVQTDVQNRPAVDLTSLTPSLLRTFDAVVTDADGLNALAPNEARQLAAATTDGLGIILTGAAELPRNLPGRAGFALQLRPATQADRPLPVHWPDGQASALSPATLRPTAGQRAVLTSTTAATVVGAAHRTGWGTAVVATPSNTFQWLLSGATTTYDAYWRQLLDAAARPLEPVAQWSSPQWPRVDEPLDLQLTAPTAPSQAARLVPATSAPVSLSFQQHPFRPEVWLAETQPTQAGWHTALAPGQDTTAVYVFSSADWPAVASAQRLAALRQRREDGAAVSATDQAPAPQVPWLAAGWYFALFLAAAGWLWLDEKR